MLLSCNITVCVAPSRVVYTSHYFIPLIDFYCSVCCSVLCPAADQCHCYGVLMLPKKPYGTRFIAAYTRLITMYNNYIYMVNFHGLYKRARDYA